MRKLKLESLQVESFETTDSMTEVRGTVQGHRPNTDGCPIVVEPGTYVSACIRCDPMTYDIRCGDTQYMDCTFGCTHNCSGIRGCSYGSGCVDVCWIDNNSAFCPVE